MSDVSNVQSWLQDLLGAMSKWLPIFTLSHVHDTVLAYR